MTGAAIAPALTLRSGSRSWLFLAVLVTLQLASWRASTRLRNALVPGDTLVDAWRNEWRASSSWAAGVGRPPLSRRRDALARRGLVDPSEAQVFSGATSSETRAVYGAGQKGDGDASDAWPDEDGEPADDDAELEDDADVEAQVDDGPSAQDSLKDSKHHQGDKGSKKGEKKNKKHHDKDKNKDKHKDKHKDKKKKNKSDGKKKHEKPHKRTHSSTSTRGRATSTGEEPTRTSTSGASTTTAGVPPSQTGVLPCQPLPLDKPPAVVCRHVRDHCPPSGHLNYLEFYFCVGLPPPLPGVEESVAAVPTPAPRPHSLLLGDGAEQLHDTQSQHGNPPHRRDPGAPQRLTPHLATLRALALALIIAWMLFMFSWIGVVASDFFCPNLSTIAARLGLSESTAGVTFLAFGNGSPDVFSTYGAMRSGAASLAIGELLGAASFIVSVVAGSMMIIAPFRVKPYPFCRDVGFFSVAVAITLVFLFDGKLRFGECVGMVGLYVTYAATVIVGTWLQERRRRRKLLMKVAREEGAPVGRGLVGLSSSRTGEFDRSFVGRDLERGGPYAFPARGGDHSLSASISPSEYDPDRGSDDDDEEDRQLHDGANVDPFDVWAQSRSRPSYSSSTRRSATHASASTPGSRGSPRLRPADMTPSSASRRASSRSRFRSAGVGKHSLLGAVEFRDVVHSLRQEAAADRSVEIFRARDPERYLPHPSHQHQHRRPAQLHPSHRSHSHALERSSSGGHHVKGKSHARNFSAGSRPSGISLPPTPLESSQYQRDRANSLDPSWSSSEEAARGASEARLGMVREDTLSVRPALERERDGSAEGLSAALPASEGAIPFDDPWREPSLGVGSSGPSGNRPSLPKIDTSGGANDGVDTLSVGFRGPSEGRRESGSSVPTIHISESVGTGFKDAANGNRLASARALGGDEKLSLGRRRGVLWNDYVKPLLRALFPSLRHLRDKSWLGVLLSLVTAPAILAFSLTLPVVDDEAEMRGLEPAPATSAQALVLAGMRGEGRGTGGGVRLEGDEQQLYARDGGGEIPYHDDDEDDEDERIIELGSGATPARRTTYDENRRRNLDVASSLRQLRGVEGLRTPSPLLRASGGELPSNVPGDDEELGDPLVADDDDDCAGSDCSEVSCSSVDSHLVSRQSAWILTLAQCVLAPPFCTWAVVDTKQPSAWRKVLLALSAGVLLAVVVLMSRTRSSSATRDEEDADEGARKAARGWSLASPRALDLLRCLAGFVVSCLWIMSIADEVVSILQTLGIVLGLSHAILGLTVFAVGNSLADLVANITIAKMGHPIMAISACFAGPLMNLLLGIGVSGSLILSGVSSTTVDGHATHAGLDGSVYHIDFSPTLLVSGLGLLAMLTATLAAVWRSGFELTRAMGVWLIGAWVCIMSVNVFVETFFASTVSQV